MTSPGLDQAIAEGRDELTDDEAREYLDAQTRTHLGMSLDEFIRAADEGSLPEHPAVPHLVLLTGARPVSC